MNLGAKPLEFIDEGHAQRKAESKLPRGMVWRRRSTDSSGLLLSHAQALSFVLRFPPGNKNLHELLSVPQYRPRHALVPVAVYAMPEVRSAMASDVVSEERHNERMRP